MDLNQSLWDGKRILVTGHTGFKGSWLTLVLKSLGAEVIGISLGPELPKSLYSEAEIKHEVSAEFFQDIRDFSSINRIMSVSKIDYAFHLAAQAFVGESIKNPTETISTNVTGTANVLVSAMNNPCLKGITVATTDKVYENLEHKIAHTETDKLGGLDPYSASKAATEIVVASISYSCNPFGIPITTVRAGNVIGGGDWGKDRLVPDLIKAFDSGSDLVLRNPNATRPWQHVLDCLYGYLLVAQSHMAAILETPKSVNFGPSESLSVTQLVNYFESTFGEKITVAPVKSNIPESLSLSLDSSLAKSFFGWKNSLSQIEAVKLTADWYLNYGRGMDAKSLMFLDIEKFKENKW